MYAPSGAYSGPSSRPGAVVRRIVQRVVALPHVHKPPAVRGPAVQVRWSFRGDALGRAAGGRHRVDDRRAAVLDCVVTDGQHAAVERQDVVVVVARREAGIDDRGRPRCEIETVEPSLLHVDERLPIVCPVGRLKRSRVLMHDRRVPGRDVENFEVAPDVLAVGDEVSLGRRRDPDGAEPRPLGDGVVVRADEQADVDRIRERNAGQALRHKRVAELRHRHEVFAIAPLELDDRVRIREAVRRFLFLCGPARLPAELQRHQAAAVQRRGHVRAPRIERGANGPADLAMLFHARADEVRSRGEDEVAADSFPDEAKIVARVPHVLTRARDHIRLLLRIVRGRTSRSADRRLIGKDADGTLSAEDVAEDGGAQDERTRPNRIHSFTATIRFIIKSACPSARALIVTRIGMGFPRARSSRMSPSVSKGRARRIFAIALNRRTTL